MQKHEEANSYMRKEHSRDGDEASPKALLPKHLRGSLGGFSSSSGLSDGSCTALNPATLQSYSLELECNSSGRQHPKPVNKQQGEHQGRRTTVAGEYTHQHSHSYHCRRRQTDSYLAILPRLSHLHTAFQPQTGPPASRPCASSASRISEAQPQHAQDTPCYSLTLEVEAALQTAHGWAWDAFRLQAACPNRTLSTLGFWAFQQCDLIANLHLNPQKLASYLCRIEAGYRTNPYHNSTHASDVLQSMFVITTHGGLYPSILDRTGLLCCLLAAIVHDFEHTGFTNDYLINTEHPIAMTYNNKAPQENHHVAAALQLLVQPEFNFLEGFGWEARLAIRRRVIDMVLATDMKAHMDIMAQFQHQMHPAEEVTHEAGSSSHQSNAKAVPLKKDSPCNPVPEQVSIALQMAIKVADVAHLAAAFPVHYRWVKCLEEEFFLQGDHEAAQELAVTRFMDRQQQGVSQSQAGFFEVIALPMFMTFVHVFPHCQPLLELVLSNYEDWRSLNDVRLAERPAPIWHTKPVVADRKRKHSTFYESATSRCQEEVEAVAAELPLLSNRLGRQLTV